jgi:hypothetical protein
MSYLQNPLTGSGFNSKALWEDIIIYPTSLGSAASSPDLSTFKGNILAYGFDGVNTLEQLYGSIEIPHSYKEGTDLRMHLHWSPSNTSIGDVKWFLEYSVSDNTDNFTETKTISFVQATNGSERFHLKDEFDEFISGLGVRIGTIISFRLYRNPSDVQDTYGSDAFILSLGAHYQVDSDGSRGVFVK